MSNIVVCKTRHALHNSFAIAFSNETPLHGSQRLAVSCSGCACSRRRFEPAGMGPAAKDPHTGEAAPLNKGGGDVSLLLPLKLALMSVGEV